MRHLLRASEIANSRLALRVTGAVPGLRSIADLAYARHFRLARGTQRLFHGVYPSFKVAQAAAPTNAFVGFDSDGAVARLAHEKHIVFPYDYPVLFWLSRLLRPGMRVFDWGGNVGTSYFAFRRVLPFPEGLDWLVQDVPAVVAAGHALPPDNPGLRFTGSMAGLAACDLLLCAGAIHFVPNPFEILRVVGKSLPRYILLNKVPAYDQPNAATLMNVGYGFSAQHLFNQAELEAAFNALGYSVADKWQTPGLGCFIPFNPSHSIDAYTGWCLTRDDQE